jgi:MGT family glycosyltransferase
MNGDESTSGGVESATNVTPRSYLFALTDGGGTIPPEFGVARRLVDRAVRKTRAQFVPCRWTPEEEFRDWELRSPLSVARGTADYMFTGPAPVQARDTAAALDAAGPDLVVVSSFALGAMVAAESRGIPFDVLLPNAYPLPAKGMPPFGSGMKPAKGLLGRMRDQILSGAGARLFDRYTIEKINTLRAEYGLNPIAHMWDQMHRARRQLILTSSAFDFPATLPDAARYVGPILDDPTWAAGKEWTAPAGNHPLVLVAMSSTFQNQVDCLQRIADALATLPVRGVLTTGPTVRPDAISAPANITVVDSAPHREVMRQASIVVTHGGHGTVVKALAAGLPLVILHHGRDQADNAARVTARGAGVAVSRRAPAPRIAQAIATVLGDDAYRRAADELGESIRQDAAGTALLDELEATTPATGRTNPSRP